MLGYSLYECKWINAANLPHVKPLIKVFEVRKLAEAKVVVTGKTTRRITKAKLPALL